MAKDKGDASSVPVCQDAPSALPTIEPSPSSETTNPVYEAE
jgi:hypothetical protein